MATMSFKMPTATNGYSSTTLFLMILILWLVISMETVYSKANCPCSTDYNPICGKDGKTYHNPCIMDCYGMEQDKTGPCGEDEPEAMYPCTCIDEELDAVCGQNGKTYGSICELICAGVLMDSEGTCAKSARG